MKKNRRKYEIARNINLQLLDLNDILTLNYKSAANYLSGLDKRMEMLTFTENLLLDFVFKENFTLDDLIKFSSKHIKDVSLKNETLEFLKELQELELEEDEHEN